ncbi:MAG TPA: nitronate monooxygenase [Xanthobacteraceae bacterium]|jgi:nitronate monooxygenase|nr:nitronate monooxygenase [Xanthobacteraceae bacterium]
MAANRLLQRLGIEHPILLAPMAGSGGTPELAAAVSQAGGQGAWGGAYSKPEEIVAAIRRIRQLTDRAFNINLFAGGYATDHAIDPQPMLDLVSEAHAVLGPPPPVLPPVPRDPFDDQLQAVLEERPPVFSFTFGVPSAAQLAALKARDIIITGTATTVDEARRLEAAGVDAIVAQGAEAGAHRGTFAAPFEDSMVPLPTLVRGICGETSLPVIASGGLMNGRDIAVVRKLGAAAAQLGTAFLPCPESGAPAAYKHALLSATKDTTVITRVYSGRPARGLTNRFIAMVSGKEHFILPFRQQNDLTRPMRNASGAQGIADYISLWAGQGVARSRQLPAAALVKMLLEESSAAEVVRA